MVSFPDNSSWFTLMLLAQMLALAGFGLWSGRFSAPGVQAFRITLLGMAGRIASEGIEWGFGAQQPEILFWALGFRSMASTLVISGHFLMFSDISGLNRWATPLRRRALIAALLLLGALAFTNPWTHWISPDEAPAVGWSFGHSRLGPLYLLLAACEITALLYGLGATLFVWRGASPLLRKQLGLLLTGCTVPVVFLFAYRGGAFPEAWPNLNPAARIAALVLFARALSREQLWRLVPIARSFVLEHHDHGMLVADRNRLVVDSNPAVRTLLGLPGKTTPYGPLDRLLAPWPALQELARHHEAATCECHPDPTSDSCWLASWNPLYNHDSSNSRGYLLSIADISERKRTETALQEALAARTREWQRATAAALRTSEEEQCRFGQLLHDTLCQDLIVCSRQAGLLQHDLESGAPPDPAHLATLRSTLDEAGRRARDISHLLAGTTHANLPFGEKLAGLLRQLETSLGLECELTIDPAFPQPDTEQGVLLLRIVREAVFNAARHGRAHRVCVDLLVGEAETLLTIGNDGQPPPPAPTEGLGLRQIRMRATLLGGRFQLRGDPAWGSCLELRFPPTFPPLSAP